MSRIAASEDRSRRIPLRAAVLAFLERAAPRPAEPGAPSDEEREFLDTLRRMVRRSNAEELWEKYHGSRPDPRDRMVRR